MEQYEHLAVDRKILYKNFDGRLYNQLEQKIK